MKCKVIGVFLTLALVSNVSFASSVKSFVNSYVDDGNKIMDMANTNNINTDQVKSLVLEITKNSVGIAREYIKKHPNGKQVLDFVIKKVAKLDSSGQVVGVGPMGDLSFDEIQHDWHDLGYFFKNDLGVDFEDEDNEHFTDPLHVMIHPIMVYRASLDQAKSPSSSNIDAIKSEMAEGIEQAKIVVDMFSH